MLEKGSFRLESWNGRNVSIFVLFNSLERQQGADVQVGQGIVGWS